MKRALVFLLVLLCAEPSGALAASPWAPQVSDQSEDSAQIRSVAVVPINFIDKRSRATTQARLGDVFFNVPNTDGHQESFQSYWEQASYGKELIEGLVLPLTPLMTSASCDFSAGDSWIDEVRAYWNERGTDLNLYDHVFLVIPRIDCEYGGYAPMPGKWSVINWDSSYWKSVRSNPSIIYILAHEYLHTRGFDHSGVVSCTKLKSKASLGGECSESSRHKYEWDPYEIITGDGYLPKWLPNSFQRITLGFISDSEQVRLSESGIHSVSLNPIEFSESLTKALVIRRTGLNQFVTPTFDDQTMTTAGAPDICIEWHQPRGWFNNFNSKSPVVRGVSMRLCDLYSGGLEYLLEDGGSETGFYQAGTRLIDATPGSKQGKADWRDAQLAKGTWIDEFTGITIRVVGFDKTGTDRSQWSIKLEVVIP